MKQEQLKIYVIAHGVRKRCRKQSREMIHVGYAPTDTNKEEWKTKALTLVADVMKECYQASINFDPVTFDTTDGVRFESWRMFDPRSEKMTLIARQA
jgi:hypothetical protein